MNQLEFYKKAVELGVFTVSPNGAKKIDMEKLLKWDSGVEKLKQVLVHNKMVDK